MKKPSKSLRIIPRFFFRISLIAFCCFFLNACLQKSTVKESENASLKTEKQKPEKPDKAAPKVEEQETTTPTTESEVGTNGSANTLLCGNNEMATLIKDFTLRHTGIAYDTLDRTTQCSGIFQRLLGTIRTECSNAEAKMPPANILDSRQQGKWYFDTSAMTLIKDPLAQSDLIVPGAVMFYGKRSQQFYNENPSNLLWSQRDGIRHVGVVVEVKKDEKTGEIQSYSLFHGRRPGTKSGITNADNYMHRRIAKPNAPSFGNGRDPWVGVAPLIIKG